MNETLFFSSTRYDILRATDAVSMQPVVIKRVAQSSDHAASWSELRNESQILGRLHGVQGCPQLLRLDSVQQQLVVEDFCGVDLESSGLPGHVELSHFLVLAERLADAIANIHWHGITHKDINPGNVLVCPENMQVQVIDFGLATTFTDEHPEFEHQSRIRGTLAYISPEQTGRMNRSVDYRTDLYALGCTLYHLATGRAPFTDTDPLTLIHAHLARTPIAPDKLSPWLPPLLSDLILDLLAKEPDNRYQSASGVATDLRLCAGQLAKGEPLEAVQRKQTDWMISPHPPRRLYGRDTEIATLNSAFARTLFGGTQSLLVTGYSGVGKTSLVHEIHPSVTAHQGLFISGKFDQFLSLPFSAPAQSLRQLCQMFLSDSEEAIERWRRCILDALGTDAAVLFGVVPELQALLGPQPPAAELGPIESQVRLRNLLLALINAVTDPAHPLVLFIDDLQWADQPSLEFIAALLNDSHISGLTLIGSYRDKEVDSTHPLTVMLRDLSVAGIVVPKLILAGLTLSDAADLLADMLHLPQEAILPLATVTYSKTGGNPFYTIEFLNALYRDGILTQNPQTHSWQWDDALLTARKASDSVVDFLSERLSLLPLETRQVLLTAACLGNEFELGALSVATATLPESLSCLMLPALEQGIVVTNSALRFQQGDLDLNIRFCHDRMQQVAYDLRSPEERMKLHLSIARRFSACEEPLSFKIRAAMHYVQAAPHLDDLAERAVARPLIAAAAVQARQAGAFASAEQLLSVAIELLPPDPWICEQAATFSLHAELHQVFFCLTRHADVDATYSDLQRFAVTPVDLVEPACIQIASLSIRTRYGDAVALTTQLLTRLGMALPVDDIMAALDEELGLFYACVEAGAFDTLHQSPVLTDPQRIAITKLLSRVIPAAFFGQPLVSLWCIMRGSRIWIEEGYFATANYLMACVLLPTVALRSDYATGYRAGRLSLDISKLRNHGTEAARTQHVFGLFNCHWFEPLESAIEHAHEAHKSLRRLGDFENAGFIFFTSLAAIFDCCEQLKESSTEIEAAMLFCSKSGNRHANESFISFRQLVRTLEGHTTVPGGFDDESFSEQTHTETVRDNPMAHAFYHVYRGVSACLFDDTQALIRHSQAAMGLIPYITGFYPVALIYFLHAVALLNQCATASAEERQALLEQLDADQTWLSLRAADAEQNFAHLLDLIEAERCDAEGQLWQAHQAFERAMTRSQAHQRVWHHALTVERFALFQMRRGQEGTGRLLLANAHRLYQSWGATGKTQFMEMRWPFLGRRQLSNMPLNDHNSNAALDNHALLHASQSLSSETSLPNLVAILIEVVSKITGATDTAFLLSDDAGEWFLEGGAQGRETLSRQNATDCEGRLFSGALLRLGLKTGKPVLSDDAINDKRFASDGYYKGIACCAVLGFPVIVHGRSAGFLILENRLIRAAFSAEQVQSVSMLAVQLAISIENARLYESLERKVAERTRELKASNEKLAALSSTDGLTGIANRRCFDDTMEIEWSRARRTGKPLSVAMLDVDWFKKYNDHYGHQAGDECLRQVARVFSGCVRRAGDLAARYGGEEFVLIAPDTDSNAALRIATLICHELEQLALPHEMSLYQHVTVSIGVATFFPIQQQDNSPEMLLKQADEALYQAKEQGRNRAVAASMVLST